MREIEFNCNVGNIHKNRNEFDISKKSIPRRKSSLDESKELESISEDRSNHAFSSTFDFCLNFNFRIRSIL